MAAIVEVADQHGPAVAQIDACTAGSTTSHSYNAVGSRSAVNHANGTATAYDYDARNRLTQLTTWDATGEVIHSQAFTLGAAGHRTRVEEHGSRVVDYDYDALYRLVTETETDPRGDRTTTYTFDAVGNRLSRTTSCNPDCFGEVESGVTTYTYDDNDRLTSETGPAGITTYDYDANGNTTRKIGPDGTVDYHYNAENRLTRATGNLDSGAMEATYAYDAHGIRQRQTVDGQTTRYLVDPVHENAQVLEELDDSATPAVLYIIGQERISQTRPEGTFTYHGDGLGSIRALSDATGTQTDTFTYEAFGQLEHRQGTTPNSFRYTGEQYDPNLGFYYLRTRYYDPSTGWFPTMDTYQGQLREPRTLHKYVYVHADPINNIDPSGLSAVALEQGIALNISARLLTAAVVVPGVAMVGHQRIRNVTQSRAAAQACASLYGTNLQDFPSGACPNVRMPILFHPEVIMPGIGEHVQKSIADGSPAILNRTFVRKSSNLLAALAKCRAGDTISVNAHGRSCDEYPFASTTQGGSSATVAKVPLPSQWVQGGIISAFYSVCLVAPDAGALSEFLVIPTRSRPGGRSFQCRFF